MEKGKDYTELAREVLRDLGFDIDDEGGEPLPIVIDDE